MGLWEKIIDVAGGSLVGSVVDTIKDYFPPSMSEQEKAQMELGITKAMQKNELAMLKATTHMEAEFNQRIKDMEGTASDLQSLPVIGRAVIFLRGLQRPTWGFGVLYIDFCVFSGQWVLAADSKLESAFWVINLLVLGFLFGERSIKNLSPLIERMLKR